MAPLTTQSQRIAFVGAGRIGLPMAQRLRASGHDVALYPKTNRHAERFASHGLPLVDLAGIHDRDVIVSCLYDNTQMADLLIGPGSLTSRVGPGTLLISHTTGHPGTLREINQALRDRGASAVEATFSGEASDVTGGGITVLLSGDDDDVERAETIVRSYAKTVIRCGKLGQAQKVKLLNNLLFAVNAQMATAAIRAGARLGLDADLITEALRSSSGASRALESLVEFAGFDSFASHAGPFMTKDIAACFEIARAEQVDLGLLATAAVDGPLDLQGSCDD